MSQQFLVIEVFAIVCLHALVTVTVEPENEEVEFLWKRFVFIRMLRC